MVLWFESLFFLVGQMEQTSQMKTELNFGEALCLR